MPEFSIKAVVLGMVLALIMCAANTYLGLYAGMTVSASIPAAVISMGILRGIMRRGTILENNIVQTAASTGESLAAGIIFTMPALVIVGIWKNFDYWTTTLVALLGGLLGVLLMIPFRRTLIVEKQELAYPEGVACAEVLKAGEEKGTSVLYVFSALGLGAVFKFFVAGLSVIKSVVEGAIRVGKTAIYAGSDISCALIGVGYIVGLNVAILVFIGGAIGWIIGIPIYGAIYGFPTKDSLIASFYQVWSTQIRYMGVGAMIVGGLWSIIEIRKSILRGLRETMLRWGLSDRISEDIKPRLLVIFLFVTAIPIFILYAYLTHSLAIAVVAGIAMLILAFFFVGVSSYIVGLVGSSNNPVSGMTIITVLFTSVLLLVFKMSGYTGIFAALGVAGVVCCAACTAGDISQDLKTGHIVGASPRRQEITQLISVLVSAFIIAPILLVLHKVYGIGTGKAGSLSAPQASLFASITTAMFTNKALPWNMILIGTFIGIALIIIKQRTRLRTHVMPTAIGIYLPFVLSVPILIGGIISLIVKKTTAKYGTSQEAIHRGTLFSSGLIAGESIMGIVIAFLIVGGIKLPITLIENSIASVIAILAVVITLILVSIKHKR